MSPLIIKKVNIILTFSISCTSFEPVFAFVVVSREEQRGGEMRRRRRRRRREAK